MALQRHGRVVGGHAAAVVSDHDTAEAAHFEADFELSGAGIKCIFYQLFDDAGWSFDDFSSRDLVYNAIFE